MKVINRHFNRNIDIYFMCIPMSARDRGDGGIFICPGMCTFVRLLDYTEKC